MHASGRVGRAVHLRRQLKPINAEAEINEARGQFGRRGGDTLFSWPRNGDRLSQRTSVFLEAVEIKPPDLIVDEARRHNWPGACCFSAAFTSQTRQCVVLGRSSQPEHTHTVLPVVPYVKTAKFAALF